MTSCIRSSKNVLVLGLAISDLCVGIFVQPSFCIHLYALFTYNFELAAISDRIFFASFTMLSMVSLGNLTAVTCDRFLAVLLHLRYNQLVTAKRNISSIIAIWICSLVACLIRLAVYSDNMAAMDIFIFVFTLVLNAFFLSRISHSIRKHSAQIHAQSSLVEQMNMPRFKKSVKTMHLIVFAFVVCYCPHVLALTYLLIIQEWNKTISFMLMATSSIMMCNGALNPVIYCWRVGEIRTALYALIQKLLHM